MFREYVHNIAMVIIFTSFLGLILPRSKHKGYIKLIAGLVVIMAVISPLATLFSGNNLEELFISAERQLNFDIATRTISKSSNLEDTMLRAIIAEHKTGIEAGLRMKISSLGYEVIDARIYIDESEEYFGMISALILTLAHETKESPGRSLIRVERVNIGQINIGADARAAANEHDEEIIAIKNLLADFYNLSVENINIIVID